MSNMHTDGAAPTGPIHTTGTPAIRLPALEADAIALKELAQVIDIDLVRARLRGEYNLTYAQKLSECIENCRSGALNEEAQFGLAELLVYEIRNSGTLVDYHKAFFRVQITDTILAARALQGVVRDSVNDALASTLISDLRAWLVPDLKGSNPSVDVSNAALRFSSALIEICSLKAMSNSSDQEEACKCWTELVTQQIARFKNAWSSSSQRDTRKIATYQTINKIWDLAEQRIPCPDEIVFLHGTAKKQREINLKALKNEIITHFEAICPLASVLNDPNSPLYSQARKFKESIESFADKIEDHAKGVRIKLYINSLTPLITSLRNKLFKGFEEAGPATLVTRSKFEDRNRGCSYWYKEVTKLNSLSPQQIAAYAAQKSQAHGSVEWTIENAHSNLALECIVEFQRLKALYEQRDNEAVKTVIDGLATLLSGFESATPNVTADSLKIFLSAITVKRRERSILDPVIERVPFLSISGELKSIEDLDRQYREVFHRLLERFRYDDPQCQPITKRWQSIRAALKTSIIVELLSGRYTEQVKGLLGAQP